MTELPARLWSEFLAAWPPERVEQMTLEEYTNPDKDDAFIYWVEARLETSEVSGAVPRSSSASTTERTPRSRKRPRAGLGREVRLAGQVREYRARGLCRLFAACSSR